MSSHKYTYVGPYLKLPQLPKPPWLDGDRLCRVDSTGRFDIWIANVGNHNLFQADDYGDAPDPCPITADMIATEPFIHAFAAEIATLRELYGDPGLVEFGIVTYWA
ncbi:hypothetical protein K0U83_10060 [bacterium]|nr:hypothetical protein [bacterium]